MYASIRRYEGSGRVDKITQLVKEDLLPILRKVPGFIAYYGIDARYGVAVTVTIFEDRGAAVKANKLAEKWAEGVLSSNFIKSPEVISGEVLVYEGIESSL